MLRNYFKTAWRNILKNKFYSVLNVAGLTVGLAIGIMILLWVQDERSYDNFHTQTPNIYRMELFGGTGASKQIWSMDVAPMGPLAKQELPEVTNQVRLMDNNMFSLYTYQGKAFTDEHAAFADPSFFSIFNFPLIKGNPAKPFTDDNSVVITRKAARRYFGTDDAIGKVLVADETRKQNFTVTGIIADFPVNSRFQYDMIMPMSFQLNGMRIHGTDMTDNFYQFAYETYLQLKPGVDAEQLTTKLTAIHLKHKADDTDAIYLLLPLAKMHLYNADMTDKGASTVSMFTAIAFIILLIACINYVNLSTARSMMRSKEISMRKIIGAAKIQLFMQFVIETALVFALATAISLMVIYMLMPLFNQVSGKQMVFNLGDYHVWSIILITIAGALAASSIYPALLLSSFEPLKALKGKITAGIGSVMFRKVLVVSQFAFSVVLIVGTIVITSQLRYIRNKNLGYDKEHVFVFPMWAMQRNYDAIRNELMKQPGIMNVARASHNIIDIGSISGDNDWDGKAANQTLIMHPMSIDKDFVSMFKLKMVEGKTFTGIPGDSAHFILNETAVKQIGLTNPIGKRFRLWTTTGTIIGVVKDFHFTSMKEKISPSIFYYLPRTFGRMYVKTTGRDAQKALAAAEVQFKKYAPQAQEPFRYAFLDDQFNSLYKGEQREGVLFNYFAGIAIFISCLGLFGLAAYTAQLRAREIGIRKVLGSSTVGVMQLLAGDFIKLVFIAIIIASPAAWYAMSKWLQGFAYKVSISWWMFALAGLTAIGIALLTISFQSIKAALANPVKSLRSE